MIQQQTRTMMAMVMIGAIEFMMASSRVTAFQQPVLAFSMIATSRTGTHQLQQTTHPLQALSSDYLENDLVGIQHKPDDKPRLCAVTPTGTVAPLCQREDDVETDLFVDPREYDETFWSSDDELTDDCVTQIYGEGFYGQRPVPSLGGGPGYGAEADPVWSTTEDVLEQVRADGVELPVLDMGIAHGEKARAGAF